MILIAAILFIIGISILFSSSANEGGQAIIGVLFLILAWHQHRLNNLEYQLQRDDDDTQVQPIRLYDKHTDEIK